MPPGCRCDQIATAAARAAAVPQIAMAAAALWDGFTAMDTHVSMPYPGARSPRAGHGDEFTLTLDCTGRRFLRRRAVGKARS
jgi:hypothetical protein